jgi:hypothetical protein
MGRVGRRRQPNLSASVSNQHGDKKPWPWGHFRLDAFETARLLFCALGGLVILAAGVAMLEPAPIILGVLLSSGSIALILIARWFSRREL